MIVQTSVHLGNAIAAILERSFSKICWLRYRRSGNLLNLSLPTILGDRAPERVVVGAKSALFDSFGFLGDLTAKSLRICSLVYSVLA